MLKASGAMAAATLFSRVLGMVREMVYARFMGDGWVASAFALAFTIPNLFRRLLGEGALTAAFIPIFKEKEKTHGEIEMWRAANAVISGLDRRGERHHRPGHARHFTRAGRASIQRKHRTHAAAAARDVSLHAARLPGGGDDGNAQCARPFFHPGDGRDDAERRDDRVGALARAAHG